MAGFMGVFPGLAFIYYTVNFLITEWGCDWTDSATEVKHSFCYKKSNVVGKLFLEDLKKSETALNFTDALEQWK